MNLLLIEKQTGGYFKFTLNGDTANAVTSIQNDLLAVGSQLHFKTGNGANIIKEQFIYPTGVTIISGGTFTFTTVAEVWNKLIEIDYFAWISGGGTGGVDRFDDLLDTFSYTGNAGKAVIVDSSELKLVPITLYNKRYFTELDDTPDALVPNKMVVVNPSGTSLILQDQPTPPEQLLNSVGYFDYDDYATSITPLTAVNNVKLKLTNDTDGANTNTSEPPYGVSYLWDYTTNQFNFSQLSIGDTVDIRVHIEVTTSSTNQRIDITSKFGIGSASQYENSIYSNQYKSTGLHEISFVAPMYIGSNDIKNYPAELYLLTDASATVRIDGWYIRVIRKNINIITVDYTVPDATLSTKGIIRLAGDLAGTANSPTVPDLANKVPNTRTISTTSPLLGGNSLSTNLTLSIQQANSTQSGYLSFADWSTFNSKAIDSNVVHLTGTETITGAKTFTVNGSNTGIQVESTSNGNGAVRVNQSTAGIGIWANNTSTGAAILSYNASTGYGLQMANMSTGKAIYIDNSITATGDPFTYTLGGAAFMKAKIDYLGNITGNSFIKIGGVSSQFLKADGSVDSNTYSLDSNVVHLAGTETITGQKTFSLDTSFNGVKVGRGAGNIGSNVMIGSNNTANTGSYNLFLGNNSGFYNTIGINNSFIGSNSGFYNTVGSYNSFLGTSSGTANTGNQNTYIGASSGNNISTGGNNVLLGFYSGAFIANKLTTTTSLSNSILLGYNTSPLADSQTNQIVIGYNATGLGSNTTVLGNSSTIQTWLGGSVLINTTTNNGIDKLQVNGSGYFSGGLSVPYDTAIKFGGDGIITQNTDNGCSFFDGGSLDTFILGANSASHLLISTDVSMYSSTGKIQLDAARTLIGAGTDDGINRLQVNGYVKATGYKISTLNTAPATATSTGTLGEIRITASAIYVCIATNTWVRSLMTTF